MDGSRPGAQPGVAEPGLRLSTGLGYLYEAVRGREVLVVPPPDLGRWDRGPVAWAIWRRGWARLFTAVVVGIHWLGAVLAGPLVTMYPSLRHGLLLVASKERRSQLQSVAPGHGRV